MSGCACTPTLAAESDMYLTSPLEIGVGFLLVLLFTGFSARFRLLTRGGTIAALFVGTLVTFFAGLAWLALLLAFHLAAAALTRFHYEAKLRKGAAELKGGARSWSNVFANGGVAALFAVFEGTFGGGIFFGGFLGALSSAASDTLATEVGLLYPGEPRLITKLSARVRAGTSGAISPYGEAAILFAASILGFVAFVFRIESWNIFKMLLVAIGAGLIGSTADSILGASFQAKYFCPHCTEATESNTHGCGTVSTLIKGRPFLNNHSVNLIATLVGGLTGVLLSAAS